MDGRPFVRRTEPGLQADSSPHHPSDLHRSHPQDPAGHFQRGLERLVECVSLRYQTAVQIHGGGDGLVGEPPGHLRDGDAFLQCGTRERAAKIVEGHVPRPVRHRSSSEARSKCWTCCRIVAATNGHGDVPAGVYGSGQAKIVPCRSGCGGSLPACRRPRASPSRPAAGRLPSITVLAPGARQGRPRGRPRYLFGWGDGRRAGQGGYDLVGLGTTPHLNGELFRRFSVALIPVRCSTSRKAGPS